MVQIGMITLNDILEAIVGDIPQPEDESYEIVTRDDGSFLVDAQIPFYDFLSHFDKAEWMKEGDQEFDTLAGFSYSVNLKKFLKQVRK
jgi:putative hemolysin